MIILRICIIIEDILLQVLRVQIILFLLTEDYGHGIMIIVSGVVHIIGILRNSIGDLLYRMIVI